MRGERRRTCPVVVAPSERFRAVYFSGSKKQDQIPSDNNIVIENVMRTTAFDIEVSNQNVILPERNMRPPLTGQPPHDHSSEYKNKAPPQTKCAFAFHPALQQP